MTTLDRVWGEIEAHQGELFHQVRGGEFRYAVRDGALVPDRTATLIHRSQFEMALERVPLVNTAHVHDLWGPSYLFAILMDPRIRPAWEVPTNPGQAHQPIREEARDKPVGRHAGKAPGVYPAGYLRELRADWP